MSIPAFKMKSDVIAFCVLNVLLCSCCFGQIRIPTLVQKIKPAVVTIVTYDEYGDTLSIGSGFFINTKGEIATNCHVFSGASRAIVKTADERIYNIQNVIAYDFDADIMLVDIENFKGKSKYLDLTTTLPKQGEAILVFGSPFGLELTVSDGIVSAIRDIPDFGNIIQITAPISPGSSGGPVVNMKGEVFGIATFQYVEGQNLNFAIPSKKLLGLTVKNEQSLSEWSELLPYGTEESAVILACVGFKYMWAAEYDSALYYLEQSILIDSLNPEIYCLLGFCYSELEEYAKAISAYKSAIHLNPEYEVAYNDMGVTYYEMGYYEKTINACQKAVHLDTNLVDSYITLGLSYDQLNQSYKAINAYQEALRIEPDNGIAYYNLGHSYYSLEKYHIAKSKFKKTIELMPDFSDAYYMLGLTYQNLEKYWEAIEQHNQVIQMDPTFENAYLNIAISLSYLENYEKAIEFSQYAVQLNQNNAEAQYMLGTLYVITDRINLARKQYNILTTIDRKLAIDLLDYINEYSLSSGKYTPSTFYGEQYVYVVKDFNDDEHLIIEFIDGTRMLLEAKTYCFTFGLLEGVVVEAKVGATDVVIYHNDKIYQYWIEED